MITRTEVREWVNGLSQDSFIAIDDGGLALVELDAEGKETGAYCEVGGVPESDDLARDSKHPRQMPINGAWSTGRPCPVCGAVTGQACGDGYVHAERFEDVAKWRKRIEGIA